MRLWIGHRLPFGLRAGISVPIGGMQSSHRYESRPVAKACDPGDWIYLIKGDHGRVKIGVSKDPTARLRKLQTGSPFPLSIVWAAAVEKNAYSIEFKAHEILDRHRVSGEWFDVVPEMAVAAITSTAFTLKENIASVEPAMIAHVVDIARATGGKDGLQQFPAPRSRSGLWWKALLFIWTAIAILSALVWYGNYIDRICMPLNADERQAMHCPSR